MDQERTAREEYVIILDFLPHGYPFQSKPGVRPGPVAQGIGKKSLSLLEIIPKKEVFLQPHEEVYVGEGKRDKVHHISARLTLDKLTGTARSALDSVLKDLIAANEAFFVGFFNQAQPLTMRMHQLELLPGLGKKHMWEIIEKRDEKPFESFEDLRRRVHLMPDPEKVVSKRILLELEGKEKHRIFVDS